jgi:hypothetical protein
LPGGQPVECVPYLPTFPGDPVGDVPRVSSPKPTSYVFTSWSALKPGFMALNTADGESLALVYQVAPMTPWNEPQDPRVTSVSAPYKSEGGALLSFDEEGRPIYLQSGGYALPPEPVHFHSPYVTGPSTLAAAGAPGIDVGLTVIPDGAKLPYSPFTSVPTTHFALVANPKVMGWEYQSFGVWNDNNPYRIGGSGVFTAGASFGAGTPASAVPTTGSATFTGKLAGLYFGPSGQGATALANVTLQADFANRSLGFASTGTTLTRDLATASAASHLDLGGTLRYSPGSNSFSGTLTNAGGNLSGPSHGRFYGPAAQEAGGVFALTSGGKEALIGGYGTKR